jgi:hypothetical protein
MARRQRRTHSATLSFSVKGPSITSTGIPKRCNKEKDLLWGIFNHNCLGAKVILQLFTGW